MDRPIEQFDTDASRSILAAVDDADERHRLTLRDYVGGLGGFGGNCSSDRRATVADELEAYAERTGVDGFNIAYHVTPGSFVDVADYLIPELRDADERTRRTIADDVAAAAIRWRIQHGCPMTIPARQSRRNKNLVDLIAHVSAHVAAL